MLTNQNIFTQTCKIHSYAKNKDGKTQKITYTVGPKKPCRATFPSADSRRTPESTQAGPRISARFMLKVGTKVKVNDLIEFPVGGVKYKVIHVHAPLGANGRAHHVRVNATAFVSSDVGV